jgi:hypothetical protein
VRGICKTVGRPGNALEVTSEVSRDRRQWSNTPVGCCRPLIYPEEVFVAGEHPNDAELEKRASFRLPVNEGSIIDHHLQACPECNARYRDLTRNQPWAPPAPSAIGSDGKPKGSM